VNYWEEWYARRRIRRRIAIMLQRTFGLYRDATVLFNVLQALDSIGYPQESVLMRAYELLKSVKMLHRISFIAENLSGGEKQRVVLARQLARDPILLPANEPTGTLDAKTAMVVHETLKNFKNTMIVTSHFPEVIRELTENALWIERGEVFAYGDSHSVIEDFEREVGKIERKGARKQERKPKIRAKNCKKYYYTSKGVVKAVDGVSFTVHEGEIFCILGRSGAGKTSLARIMCGIDEASEGSVEIMVGDEWKDVSDRSNRVKYELYKRIVMLHQEYALYSGTVSANLTSAIGVGMPSELGKLKAKFVLEGLGFSPSEAEEILQKSVDKLSVGQRHRVAPAQVFMKGPEVAILDEPTGTIDAITKKSIADSIVFARNNHHT